MTSQLISKLKEQEKQISTMLYGMEEITKIYILSKVADLSELMIAEHAVAKSSLARLWTQTMQVRDTETGELRPMTFRIVTSSEVEEALLAYIDPLAFRNENIIRMKRGELMSKDHVFIDEFYLWNNRYRAKLHQLLEEHSYAGLSVLTKTYTFATNPLAEWYSGQVEERNLATEDRIDVFIPIFQPNITSTQKMLRKFSKYGKKEPPLNPIVTWEDYEKMRQEVLNIDVPSDKAVWLSLLAEEMACCRYTKSKFDIGQAQMSLKCKECNRNNQICAKAGLSKPRFIRATILLAKALAWYDGRTSVEYEDLNQAIKYTLPHRLIVLGKQVSMLDMGEMIEEIIRLFNEDMESMRNRDVFNKLEEIIIASREDKPKFLADDANALRTEIQEELPFLNYCNEVIGYAQNRVKDYYLKEVKNVSPEKINEFRDALDESHLDEYIKQEILESAGIEYVPKAEKVKEKKTSKTN